LIIEQLRPRFLAAVWGKSWSAGILASMVRHKCDPGTREGVLESVRSGKGTAFPHCKRRSSIERRIPGAKFQIPKGGPDSFTHLQPYRTAGGQPRPNLCFPSVLPRQNMATFDGDKDFSSPWRRDWP